MRKKAWRSDDMEEGVRAFFETRLPSRAISDFCSLKRLVFRMAEEDSKLCKFSGHQFPGKHLSLGSGRAGDRAQFLFRSQKRATKEKRSACFTGH